MGFYIQHPGTYKIHGPYETKREAGVEAIRLNERDEDHPSYLLIGGGDKLRVLGRLWRDFGKGFDLAGCWKRR